MTIATPTAAPVDLAAVKTKQQAMWASGDFAVIGTTLQIVGELLCEAADVGGGEKVLDVAAGNGNATLAAARRFARVTSTDYVPALLEGGRRRAEAEGLVVTFEGADAEALPYPNASFDVILSTFGVMFAPDQERAAAELVRVVRPGGRIGLASWTPEGFLGALFRVISTFVPSPAGVRSPMAWGSKPRIVEMFARQSSAIHTERRTFAFRYRSAEHFVAFFRTYYGPTHKAFAVLDEAGRRVLEAALVDLLRASNTHKGGALVVPAEYLEVVITK
jgi:ubiquinone/menaquinone biosynthesis C-methylase UbiE